MKRSIRRFGAVKCLENSRGFTLLECLLIMLIIGIMLGITVPIMKGPLAHYRLYTAGREMVSQIRELQQRAFTEEKNSYKVKFFVDPGRNISTDRYYIMDGIKNLETIRLPADLNLYETNFSEDTMSITCSGYPLNGFGGTIQLENDNSERLYIIVAKTGRVRMDNKPPGSVN